ncbi:unnamed protein product [Strongylus vulgaris]|uniref:Uncharacterized protein n=1 Tax=Strongylus vulgaris TaxID=40348 RepID=A0A3P7JRA8_STRVU|nr:unnamed protein product [Strongylus vulgaris]
MHPSMTLRSGKSVYSGYSTNRNAGMAIMMKIFIIKALNMGLNPR